MQNTIPPETSVHEDDDLTQDWTRRDLLRPTVAGLTMLGVGGLAPNALAKKPESSGHDLVPAYDTDQPVPVREGLGILIVGASSGMGAELARQYAAHGAYIVLAARRTDRLNQVAQEVHGLGGVAHVVTTDVRHEPECVTLIQESIQWLSAHGKVMNLLALAPIRAQVAAFGPELSTNVWRRVIDTNYFGPAFCLQHALQHLKENASTVFYFNSISSSVGTPLVCSYAASKHAWQAIMKAIKFENPEITIVSSQFNAIDTEAFDKELTYFDNDKRYCPGFYKTYSTPASQMYPESFAVEKVVNGIERGTINLFLSLLNQAAWLIGFTHQELGWFLTTLEQELGYERVLKAEREIKRKLARRGAGAYVNRLLRKIRRRGKVNELVQTATLLQSLDWSVAIFLLALDDHLDKNEVTETRETIAFRNQGIADGSFKQLTLGLSSGIFSPSGIADDNDGAAPVTACPPFIPPGWE